MDRKTRVKDQDTKILKLIFKFDKNMQVIL